MKKNILLFGALIGAFLLVSCSGGNKKQAASSVTHRHDDFLFDLAAELFSQ